MLIRTCFLVAGSVFWGLASGTTITFDDVPGSCAPATPVPSGYMGLTWTNFAIVNATTSPCSLAGYGTALTSSPNVGLNGFGLPASFSSPTPFTFDSAYFAAAFFDGLAVSVTAKSGITTVGTANFTLNTTTKELVTFSFGPVTEVDFSASGGTLNPNIVGFGRGGTVFAFDNLTFNTSGVVPEPASIGFLIPGAALLLCLIRRARKVAPP